MLLLTRWRSVVPCCPIWRVWASSVGGAPTLWNPGVPMSPTGSCCCCCVQRTFISNEFCQDKSRVIQVLAINTFLPCADGECLADRTGGGGSATARKSSSSSSSMSQASLVLRANSWKLDAFLDLRWLSLGFVSLGYLKKLIKRKRGMSYTN